jgi:DNA-binding transcriptional LysR family regulator
MLDGLPTFVAVAEAGSFSAVATSQGAAVSSITRRIELLEVELKSKLFTRSSRRIRLTDAGEQLLPRARIILAEMMEAKEGLAALSADPHGVLTVTAPALFGRKHVTPAIVSFLQQYPALEVELHSSDDIVDLAERRFDVAIRIGALTDGDLLVTHLAPIRRIVCASPKYLERAGRPETPIDLLEHNCLTKASNHVSSGWWEFADTPRDFASRIKGSLRSDDTGVLLEAAVEGVGIVYLGSWLVSEAIRDGRLVALLPQEEQIRKSVRFIQAVRMPGRSSAIKSKMFVDHLRKTYGSPPYWEQDLPS